MGGPDRGRAACTRIRRFKYSSAYRHVAVTLGVPQVVPYDVDHALNGIARRVR